MKNILTYYVLDLNQILPTLYKYNTKNFPEQYLKIIFDFMICVSCSSQDLSSYSLPGDKILQGKCSHMLKRQPSFRKEYQSLSPSF